MQVGDSISGLRRAVYWSLAGFFFVLAMIGVVLPGLPTTPFLLLMCHFLIRVSPSLHAKALAWPLVGGPLRDWRDSRGIRPGVRVTACTMVSLLVAGTLVLGSLPVALKVAVAAAALYGIAVILRLPTVREVGAEPVRSRPSPHHF